MVCELAMIETERSLSLACELGIQQVTVQAEHVEVLKCQLWCKQRHISSFALANS